MEGKAGVVRDLARSGIHEARAANPIDKRNNTGWPGKGRIRQFLNGFEGLSLQIWRAMATVLVNFAPVVRRQH